MKQNNLKLAALKSCFNYCRVALLVLPLIGVLPETSSATTYVYEAANPRQASDDYPGSYNTYPGYLDYVKFQYNDVSEVFSMVAKFKNDFAPTEGFRLTLNDGKSLPSSSNDGVLLFAHEDKDNPGKLAGSIYSYSPITFNEHLSTDLLASKSEFDSLSASSVTRNASEVTYELTLDTSSLASKFSGPVLSFDETIGIWFPWFTNINPEYDTNGRLLTWYAPGTTHALGAGSRYSMLDTREPVATISFEEPMNPSTEVPEPASMALLFSGLLGARISKRKLQE